MRSLITTIAACLACGMSAAMAAPADGTTQSAPASLHSLIASLPACESSHGDGRIDLEEACIGNLCAHHTTAQLDQRARTSACHQRKTGSTTFCTFDDVKAQRSARQDPDNPVGSIFPVKGFRGKTSDGLGLGVSVVCFIDALPAPNKVSLELDDHGSYIVKGMRFRDPGVSISDRDGDGRVDSMQLISRAHTLGHRNPKRAVPVPR